MHPLWENNLIQFARLLSEISAIENHPTMADNLCASMDISPEELEQLFERAHNSWEKAKTEFL